MTTKKKRKKKPGQAKAGSKKKNSTSKAVEDDAAPGEKKSKPLHRVQGVRVLTPGGKKPGKRGASGHLKLSQIRVVKGFNPRTTLGSTDELARSIRKSGILHPLVVRPSDDGKTFLLVAGERRYVALKGLGSPFTDHVPVNIRVDLMDDELAAKAVAVAENSEDGRTNLSYVEIGRVCAELERKKWSIARISAETALHPKKVRRALDLINAPDAIVSRVQAGELLPIAALEIAKLDEDQQAAVLDKVGPGATVAEVRQARKELDREARRAAVADGKDEGKTKTGKAKERVLAAWKSAKVKTASIRQLCYDFANAEEVGTDGWHELRGAIAYAMWDRGEIEAPVLPSIHTEDSDDPSAAKKVNAVFDGIVRNEASLHQGEVEEEEVAEEAADDADDVDEAVESEDVEPKPKKRKGKGKKRKS